MPAKGDRSAHVFTVFSTKGGSGKTVIATNLAVCFARQGKRTLLIDFDLHSGDDALVLGLSPRWTVLDLVQSPGDLDAEKLAGFVTRHVSGVDLLPAPTRPDEEELVEIDRLEPLLAVARQSYDAVVIDTSSQFAPATLLAIDHTDSLLLVGASDVPTIKSLKIALETLDLLEMQLTDVRIVMNRSGARVGLDDRDVERTLRRDITYTLPSDKATPISVNRGQPVVVDEPKSRVARCPQRDGPVARRGGREPAMKPDRSRTLGGPACGGSTRTPPKDDSTEEARTVRRDQVRRCRSRRCASSAGAARGRGGRGEAARGRAARGRRGAGRGRHPAVDRPTLSGWCARSPRTSSATARSSRSWPTRRSPR